jgi:hypothetical protein
MMLNINSIVTFNKKRSNHGAGLPRRGGRTTLATGHKVMISTSGRFRLDTNGVVAEGSAFQHVFVVEEGSQAVPDYKVRDCIYPRDLECRRELIETGVLVKTPGGVYTFSEDYFFNSRTCAANVITGSHVDGNKYWKPLPGLVTRFGRLPVADQDLPIPQDGPPTPGACNGQGQGEAETINS